MERSHSDLTEIQIAHHAIMGNERLAGFTLLYVHGDVAVNADAVIDEFARKHPQRMQLANILAANTDEAGHFTNTMR